MQNNPINLIYYKGKIFIFPFLVEGKGESIIKSKRIILIILIISIVFILSACQSNRQGLWGSSNENYDAGIMEMAQIKKNEFMDLSSDLLVSIGGIGVFLAVLVTGFKIIFLSKNLKARLEAMSALNYILVGVIILSTLSLTTGLIMDYTQSVQPDLITTLETEPIELLDAEIEEDRGNFFTFALSSFLSIIINFFTYVQRILFGEDFKGVVNMIFTEAINLPHAPFTNREWAFLNQLYLATASVAGTLVMLMVGKTGLSYIVYSHSPQKRERLTGDIQRWFLMGILLALAPILVSALTKLFNVIILMMYSSFAAGNILENLMGKNMIGTIQTSSNFTTKVAQCLYMSTELRIIVIFAVRKVVLTVMYAFTPIAIAIWGLSDRSHASAVWFGEMITNLTMSLFYSFSLFVMIGTLKASNSLSNWFLVIIWMMSIIPITKILRNSLQGLFMMLAGVDEEALGSSAVGTIGNFFGTAGAMMAGAGAAMMTTFKGRSAKDPMNIFNKAAEGLAGAGTGAGSSGIGKPPTYSGPAEGGSPPAASGSIGIGYDKDIVAGLDERMAQTENNAGLSGGTTGTSCSKASSNEIPVGNKYAKKLTEKYNNLINSKGYKSYSAAKSIAKTTAMLGYSFVSNAAQMVFGNDPAYAYTVKNISSFGKSTLDTMGQFLDKGINVRMAGNVIHETVDDIRTEEPEISYKEAINKIFNQKLDDPYRMERVKVIGDLMNTREGTAPPRGKIIYNTPAYTSIDGMNFKY